MSRSKFEPSTPATLTLNTITQLIFINERSVFSVKYELKTIELIVPTQFLSLSSLPNALPALERVSDQE